MPPPMVLRGLVLFFLVLTINVFAGEITGTINISDVEFSDIDGYLIPKGEGYSFIGEKDGYPILMIKNIGYVLPLDAQNVRIEITNIEQDTLDIRGKIYPYVPMDTFFISDSIYNSADVYPNNNIIKINEGYKNGWHLVYASMNILNYISSEGKIILNKRIDYKITYDERGILADGVVDLVPSNIREEIRNEIDSMVLNPEMVDIYAPSEEEIADENKVDLVIITPTEWKDILVPVMEWKNKRGLRTKIVTVDSILNTIVRGYDAAEKVKGFIKNAYLYNGTRYFLFFGSDDGNLDCWEYNNDEGLDEAPGVFVPAREALITHSGDEGYSPYELYKPDIYYAGLDGYWDWDQDGIFGESEDSRDMDMYPDVIVGRVLAESREQAEIYARKILLHEKEYPYGIAKNLLIYNGVETWQEGDEEALREIDTALIYLNDVGDITFFNRDTNNQTDSIIKYMNEGNGYIMGIAHGSPGGIALNGRDFVVDSGINELTEDSLLFGIYIGMSCSPGFYKLNSFAENILCNSGGEEITSGVSAIMIPYKEAYFYDDILIEMSKILRNLKSRGYSHTGDIINAYWLENISREKEQANMNLYGDPTLPLYFEGPYEMSIGMYDLDNGEMLIQVKDKETRNDIGNVDICLIVIDSNTGDTLYYDVRHTPRGIATFYTDVNFIDEGIKTYAVATAKNYYPVEDSLIGKGYKDNIVLSCPDVIPIMTEDTIKVSVYGIDPETYEIKPIPMARVILDNELGWDNYRFYREVYTNDNGYAEIPLNDTDIRSTHTIEIKVDKAGYEEIEKSINPYMWTSDPEAFGTNSQNRISLYIENDTREWWVLYSDGRYINAGYSVDADGPWRLIRINRGKNPDMVAIPGGLFGIWTTGTGLGYAIKHSPWTGDTVYPDIFVYQEPIMSISPENDSLYLGYLYLDYYNPAAEGFNYAFHHLWVEEDTLHDVDSEIVVPEDGDVWFSNIKANHSPVVAMFELENMYIPAIGFIDSRDRFTIKMRKIEGGIPQNSWAFPEQPGDTNNIAFRPFAIGFGNSMHFMWEEHNPENGLTYLLRYKIDATGEDLDTIRYGGLGYVKSPYPEFFEYVDRGYNVIHLLIPTSTGHRDEIYYRGDDSIYYPDIKVFFDPYDTTNSGTYYGTIMFAEKYDSIYKININSIEYGGVAQAFYYNEYDYGKSYENSNDSNSVYIEEKVKGLNMNMGYYAEIKTEGNIKGAYRVYIDGKKYDIITPHRKKVVIDIPIDLYGEDREIDIEVKGKHKIDGKLTVSVYEYLKRDGTKGMISNIYTIKGDNFAYIMREVKDVVYVIPDGNIININYGIAKDEKIEMSLYDISGRKIKELYKGYRNKGYYNIKMNKEEIPTGVYMLIYKVGDKVINKKIANVR